jgi:hypothetical protein
MACFPFLIGLSILPEIQIAHAISNARFSGGSRENPRLYSFDLKKSLLRRKT